MTKTLEHNINKKYTPIGNRVILPRYTYNSWMKTCPNSDVAEWVSQTMPENVYEFAADFLSTTEPDCPETIKIGTIGPDYFEWLKDRGFLNSRENRMRYLSELSDDKAFELMKSAGLARAYKLLCFHVMIVATNMTFLPQRTLFHIPRESRDEMEAYLEKIYGKGNVYIPGYIVKGDVLYNDRGKFFSMAESFFRTGDRPLLSSWREQKFDTEVMISVLTVPLAINIPVRSAVMSAEKIIRNAYPEDVILTREALSERGVEDAEDFKASKAYDALKSCFKGKFDVDVHNLLVDILELPELDESFRRQIQNLGY